MNPLNDRESFVRLLAGTVVTTGLILGYFVDHLLCLVTLFAGLNLFQSSFTGFCPPELFYDQYLAE
ncbi:MAG: DUF2892 domain-containing protein [Candidatus Nanohaloarchaea archaeon]